MKISLLIMIKHTTGNILDSKTRGIVNTVNCDGFMGKGIAYQFKLRFPKNNLEYIKQCKSKNVKIGEILCIEEEEIEFWFARDLQHLLGYSE